jgi:hypothetical protein
VHAAPHYPQAAAVLELVGRLYEVEAAVGAGNTEARAQRREFGHTRSRPIVAEIYAWLTGQSVLPRSSLGTAIQYTLSLWPGLPKFLDNPDIPLDTNEVERGMRAVALGRKNHYGSRSERGRASPRSSTA